MILSLSLPSPEPETCTFSQLQKQARLMDGYVHCNQNREKLHGICHELTNECISKEIYTRHTGKHNAF